MNNYKSCREGFGKALIEIGKKNKNIVAITADLAPSVKMDLFKKKFPNRFFDVGVAEQNLATIGSGLAHIGKIPFISSFGMFCPGRCWEQIRNTIAYNNNNVKIVSTHCGLNVGQDGATHQMLEDIAIMRTIPNIIVIAPCDYEQTKKATHAISEYKGPCYMRLGRSKSRNITTPKTKFKIGKAQVLKKGKDIAIIGCGPVLAKALDAAKLSKKSIEVINMHTIKPLDKKKLIYVVKKFKKIITIEDHQVNGGLGSAISEFLSEIKPIKIIRLGIHDSFGESGKEEELFKKHGLSINNILKYLDE